jgi:hypothetical protein
MAGPTGKVTHELEGQGLKEVMSAYNVLYFSIPFMQKQVGCRFANGLNEGAWDIWRI